MREGYGGRVVGLGGGGLEGSGENRFKARWERGGGVDSTAYDPTRVSAENWAALSNCTKPNATYRHKAPSYDIKP